MRRGCDSPIAATEKKEGKTLDSALHATRNRRKGPVTRAIRAIASAALAAALHSGTAGAQIPEADPAESEAKATEETANNSTEATPTAAEPIPVKPSKRTSRPFEPTERIKAESVVSFPANI